MPKISEYEIGIIKSLLKMGYPNQKILGLINNSRGDIDKYINSGRIAEIKKGLIGGEISEANQDEVLVFVKEFKKIKQADSEDEIERLLWVNSNGTLNIQENERIEFKETFHNFSQNKILNTIQGFANRDGGYILFGIKEKNDEDSYRKYGEPIGITDEKLKEFNCDEQEITTSIKNYVGEEIEIKRHTRYIEGKKIAILEIVKSNNKPIINRNGEIYYRYSGQVSKIQKLDLKRILEEQREKEVLQTLSKHIETILKNGIENSAILNISTGKIEGRSGSIFIDEKLLPKINFIKEGYFVEKEGSPAFILRGEVEAIGVQNIEKFTNIDNDLIFDVFLLQKDVDKDSAFNFLFAIFKTKGNWFPIRYYAFKAGIKKDELKKKIEEIRSGMLRHKQIDKKISSFYELENYKSNIDTYKKCILNKNNLIELIKKDLDIDHIAESIMNLDIKEINQDYIFTQLKSIYEYCKKRKSPHLTQVRKAIAYIDRVLYDEKIN